MRLVVLHRFGEIYFLTNVFLIGVRDFWDNRRKSSVPMQTHRASPPNIGAVVTKGWMETQAVNDRRQTVKAVSNMCDINELQTQNPQRKTTLQLSSYFTIKLRTTSEADNVLPDRRILNQKTLQTLLTKWYLSGMEPLQSHE